MLTKKTENGKWTPNSVASLELHLNQLLRPHVDLKPSKRNGMLSNLAYSLQYLEFLDRTIEDLKLTEVLYKQSIKMFVIVGTSIIESLFYYILIENGRAAKTEWMSVTKLPPTEYEEGGVRKKIIQEVFVKLPRPELEVMAFDAMCKKVEQRGLARLTSGEFYKHLPHLRKLRNRVHIHTCEDGGDTDYFNFEKSDLELTKRVLRLLITSPLFHQKNEALWNFLVVA